MTNQIGNTGYTAEELITLVADAQHMRKIWEANEAEAPSDERERMLVGLAFDQGRYVGMLEAAGWTVPVTREKDLARLDAATVRRLAINNETPLQYVDAIIA